MKKAECTIHFSNYLMEQEDTTRINALSSDTLPAGFLPMGLLTGRQSCQASQATSSTSPNPTGFDVETRPGSNQRALWYWGCAASSSSCQERLSLAWQDASDGRRTGVCRHPRGPWSLHEQPRSAAYFRCNCQAAEPLFSGWGCVCESHSAMIRKVKLSAENNIPVKHS